MNFWKNRPLVITVILTIVLVTLLITTANTDSRSGPVSILGGILKPVQSFFYNITEEIGMFFEGKASSAELQDAECTTAGTNNLFMKSSCEIIRS